MRVRRKVVFDWLVFLQANHPDYRSLEIDEDNLLALPEDGPITEQLPAREVDEPFFPNLGRYSEQSRTSERRSERA